MSTDEGRWSDKKLNEFHDEFLEHMKDEEEERKRQEEIHEALFRKEDKELGTPPGALQLMAQMNERLKAMEIKQDRQKSFVGGVLFAISSVWFFLTDAGQKLAVLFHKLFS